MVRGVPVDNNNQFPDVVRTRIAANLADPGSPEGAALGGRIPNASTTVRGLVELATSAESITGTDGVRALTPAGLAAVLDALSTSNRGFVSGGPGTDYRVVAGVLRNTGSGFTVLDDAAHTPIGIASVSSDATKITVNYSFTAATVGGLVVACDETFAQLGYVPGPSVGLSSSDINISQPGGWADYVSWNGTSWDSFNGLVTSTSINGTTGLITCNHAAITLDGGSKVGGAVTIRTAGANRVSLDSLGATSTTFTVYPYNSTTSVKAASTDMRFWITRSGSRQVSPNEMVQANSNLWVFGIFEV